MTRTSSLLIAVLTAACLTGPAVAGEITGNGKLKDVRGRSECAFSGLNDLDPDPRDPGEKTQNYGTLVRLGIFNPQDLDPNADAPFVPIPGFACNPNRGNDLHADE